MTALRAHYALARVVDADSYSQLTVTQWSEANHDNACHNWAACRAARLSADLATQPQVRARVATLQRQLSEMRALEGRLAGIRAAVRCTPTPFPAVPPG